VKQVEQGTAGVELDEEVNVAGGGVVSASDRTEQRHGATAVLPHDLGDLVPLGVDDNTPVTRASKRTAGAARRSGTIEPDGGHGPGPASPDEGFEETWRQESDGSHPLAVPQDNSVQQLRSVSPHPWDVRTEC